MTKEELKKSADTIETAWQAEICRDANAHFLPSREQFFSWAGIGWESVAPQAFVALRKKCVEWVNNDEEVLINRAVKYASGIMRNMKMVKEAMSEE